MLSSTEWNQCDQETFWGDIAENDHVVQIYENDEKLMEMLAGYALSGFRAGDSLIVIVDKIHLSTLRDQIKLAGYNVDDLIKKDLLIPLDVDETLSRFMVNGVPNEQYFVQTIRPIIERARKAGNKVRAFGEMVAVLWDRGNKLATIELEHQWNHFCATEKLSLFCAYPKKGFSTDAGASIMHICGAHSIVIGHSADGPKQVGYKRISAKNALIG